MSNLYLYTGVFGSVNGMGMRGMGMGGMGMGLNGNGNEMVSQGVKRV